MPRGGRRVGAGRKKGQEGLNPARVLSIRRPTKPEPLPVAAMEVGSLGEPPASLPECAKGIWRELAPFAVGERTLTEATASGFAELCIQSADLKAIHQTIQRLGAGTKEAEPYFRTYLKLAQRLDSSLARFKLTAFGKPAVSDKPKAAANPWAQVAGKL